MKIRDFNMTLVQAGGKPTAVGDTSIVADFGDPAGEYAVAKTGAGAAALGLRGVVEIAGKDRSTWLNNLVTNAVKDLQPRRGLYNFALNAKGRILFDFHVLARQDTLWLDVDRRTVPALLAHFDRYLFSEDVKLRDRTAEFCRLAVVGPRVGEILRVAATAEPAEGAVANMEMLASKDLPLLGRPHFVVRTDFAGVPGYELYIEAADAAACWQRLAESGARPVGYTALESLRVEAGVPASIQDLNQEILPAETNQFARAVSTTKGCYLGQEVVERMRSREVVARRFVGLHFTAPIAPPAELRLNGATVGVVTSACESLGLKTPIGLGHVKTSEAEPGRTLEVAGHGGVTATIASLPLVSPSPI